MVLFKRKLIQMVSKTILVVEPAALGKTAPHRVTNLGNIDILVSSGELNGEAAKKIEETGVRVVLAG